MKPRFSVLLQRQITNRKKISLGPNTIIPKIVISKTFERTLRETSCFKMASKSQITIQFCVFFVIPSSLTTLTFYRSASRRCLGPRPDSNAFCPYQVSNELVVASPSLSLMTTLTEYWQDESHTCVYGICTCSISQQYSVG